MVFFKVNSASVGHSWKIIKANMRHLIRVWSGTAQDLNTFFLYDAFLSSSGVFLPLHGWQRRTGRHGRENIQIRISAKVTKVLLTQAPKNTEMLPVSVCGKKCKYYTNFTHCCFGWQWNETLFKSEFTGFLNSIHMCTALSFVNLFACQRGRIKH